MKKSELINYLGRPVHKAAERLGYADRQSLNRFPDDLDGKHKNVIFMRMRANRIKIPKEWL